MIEKSCLVCRQSQPTTEFYDDTRSTCRTCVKARSLAWGRANHDVVNARHRVRNKKPEVIAARKAYYELHKAEIRAERNARPAEEKRAENRKQKLKRYGVTLEDYDSMFAEQKGVCKICDSEKSQRKGDRYLYVDHCHTTGKIRGLLCHHCNAGIGHFKDNIVLLTKAAEYLRE